MLCMYATFFQILQNEAKCASGSSFMRLYFSRRCQENRDGPSVKSVVLLGADACDRASAWPAEPGASVFYRDQNGAVFHTYSTYARGWIFF